MNAEIPDERRFDSEAEYRTAILAILEQASVRIRVLDFDLSRMNLDRVPAITHLENFLSRGAKQELLIAFHSSAFLARRTSRLLDLLSRNADSVQLRKIPEAFRHLADAHVLADSRQAVRRFHTDHARGSIIHHDPEQIAAWEKRFDELWLLCEPIATIKPLGL
jgi:hypothetical protein